MASRRRGAGPNDPNLLQGAHYALFRLTDRNLILCFIAFWIFSVWLGRSGSMASPSSGESEARI